MSFPADFIWGAATSAYQIEGAAYEDGRGTSVWDAFCDRPGAVHQGENGAVACDHYHRYREDVALMRDIGLKAYRFSVAWPRVMPEGVGAVNSAGLAFYDRLVDELLAAKIQPWVTLFHWDLPMELYRRGGWLNPDSPHWFADYTRVIVDRLSDRVSHWITLNEPQCFTSLGHHSCTHAPGDKLAPEQLLQASHHVLLAHGESVQVIRARAKMQASIGWSPTGDVPLPATETPDDIAAAREAFWTISEPGTFNYAWWLEPVLNGCYPEQGLRFYGAAAPKFTAAQMETIRQPLDFLGLNLYNGYRCRASATGEPERLPYPAGFPQMHNHWNVTPQVLRWGPLFAHERSGLPVVITENGMAGHDWVHLDRAVHDAHRIDYLQRNLGELRRAMAEGVPVRGYFTWSFLDNFEWAEGYRYRFGLVHVDYATQKRTPKDSARWYRDVIRSNGAIVEA